MKTMKTLKSKTCLIVVLTLCSLISGTILQASETKTKKSWPARVLITNDNGISDVKIIELARAFSEIAETYVVSAMTDRSGTGNFMSIVREKTSVRVEKRDLGPGITAYALDGYPADCVLWAFRGLLKDKLPDLVVSGINGGPNLGFSWFNSGTVGAARTAALGGMPVIAVSGLKQSIPGAVKAATDWVVRLSQSSIVRNLKNGQYLTVSIPRVAPSEIKGIKIVPRALPEASNIPFFTRDETKNTKPNSEIWKINPPPAQPKPTGDIAAYVQNYIAIVPMNVNEVDKARIPELRKLQSTLPPWQADKNSKKGTKKGTGKH
ncbi:MAG: hypothetical protein GY940_15730 [bacterium]|nr:hypothetical protein [bacterium]